MWVDYDKEKHSTNIHSGIGDVMAVLSALIYGLGDVTSEYCVKNVDRYELLGMLGLFGAIFTGITFPWIEREALSKIFSERSDVEQMEILSILVWYTLSVLLYYIGEALFLVASDATLLNLSMQTSNLWAMLFSFLTFHVLPPELFYPALLLVVSGVCVYELRPTLSIDNENVDEAQRLPAITDSNGYAAVAVSESLATAQEVV